VLKLIHKNAKELERWASKEANRVRKAHQTAAKVEGFRLMNKMILEVKAGAPGGQPFQPLTAIARKTSGASVSRGRVPARKRFTKLYSTQKASRYLKGIPPIRYKTKILGKTTRVSIGFVGNLSKSWIRIMQKQQEGFSIPATKSKRRLLASIGAAMSKRSKYRKYFFIKKSTTRFRIPASPIIDPFWRANKAQARINIIRNFERKMAGERI